MGTWTLITGGTVIDGTGAAAKPGCDVLLHGDRIAAVGPALDREQHVPRGDTLVTVDATGRTVMPGLIDVHCHTSFGEVRMQEEQCLYTSRELRVLRSATNLPRLLRAGVTSVSVPGGSYFIDVALREGVKEGILKGPRMAVASRFLSTDNGIGSYYPSDVGVPEGSVGQVVNTVDDMVREVRFQVKNGVDLVKIGDSVYGQHEAFSCDEMKAIVDTAHRLNTKVTIHARGSNNVRSAVRAGVDWIQHANVMTDDVIDELAESRIPVAPVLVLLANLLDFGSIVGVPVWKRDVYRRLLDQASETYNKARKAGVVFMTGTDSGFAATPYGEWHAREIELLMTYAGLSALDAIAAATKNAAVTLCGKHDVGSIEVGKAADVIVVDGDPLRDIRVLQDRRNIAVVIAAGVIQHFDDDALATRHPYDRAQHIAPGEITWDVVFGSGDASGLDLANLNQDIAMDMVRDLRAAGKAAAGQAEE